MFSFNWPGIAMLMGGALIGLIVRTLVAPDFELLSLLIGASIMLVADLVYRFRSDQADTNFRKWLGLRYGGAIAIFPVWILGIILMGMAVYSITTGVDILN